MGTISSGTGLISGLDIESIVTQLMAIESKTKTNVETLSATLTKQKTALMSLQAYVMAIQVSAANFKEESVFQKKTVTSSNEDVVTATAGTTAVLGNYTFRVKQLATNHNMVSRSYSSLNSSVGTGQITLEIGQGQLRKDTYLNSLNGGSGVDRGKIQITDKSGKTATLDLSAALTVQDVLDAINDNADIQVEAFVSNDQITLRDVSGGAGTLTVSEVNGGSTAAGLGILGTSAGTELTGGTVNFLSDETLLKSLNDGNGVRGVTSSKLDDIEFQLNGSKLFSVGIGTVMSRTEGSPEQSTTLQSLNGGNGVRLGTIKITDMNKVSFEVDLSTLGSGATLGQVEQLIEQTAIDNGLYTEDSAGVKTSTIQFNFDAQDHITIRDTSKAYTFDQNGNRVVVTDPAAVRSSHLIVEDVDEGTAAADLGIVGDTKYGTIQGSQVWFMEDVGDVRNAINNHWANFDRETGSRLVEVGINAARTGLNITNRTGENGLSVKVADSSSNASVSESWLGVDLGLIADSNAFVGGVYEGRRILSGMNTVFLGSLNGGSSRDVMNVDGTFSYGADRILASDLVNDAEGVALHIQDRAGTTVDVDLTGASTVQDLITRINAAGTNIRAAVNSAGNGVTLTDAVGGAGNLVVSGKVADKLGLTVDGAVSAVNSGNRQLQYMTEATELSSLNYGSGIQKGKFTITDSSGQKFTINLNDSNVKTLEDVIAKINSASLSGSNGSSTVFSTVKARLNDSGDGILLYDANGSFTVADVSGGTTAKDLRIAGTASLTNGGAAYAIDGSYELRLDMGGGDTIEDLVSRINEADMGVQATLINVGSSQNPSYRINFTSDVSGRAGRIYLDAGDTNLTAQTLTEARDAVVLMGESGNLLIQSSTNTITDAIKGVTLNLVSADAEKAVSVAVDQDLDSIVSQISSFVSSFNTAMKAIADLTSFNTETYEKGTLFADSTVRNIRAMLESLVSYEVPGMSGSYSRLSQVGITLASMGTETGTDASGKTVNYAVASTVQLQFDETAFREAFAADPEAMEEFFTQTESGFGEYLAGALEDLAGTSGSTISYRLTAMNDKLGMYDDRIAYLEEILAAKEQRLYNQFYAMEEALASMQSQQTALTQLSSLVSSWKRS